MIEKTILDYLNSALTQPVWMEVPKGEPLPAEYVLLEKTGSSRKDHINYATFAIQSYANSMYAAAVLNEAVKEAMDAIITLDAIGKSALNSDYNFTDTETKKYRYQAVYDITHY